MAAKARGAATGSQRKGSKTTAPRQRSRKKATVRVKGALFDPDSPVVITAQELIATHTGGTGACCARCGMPDPCPTARHALEVCRAAGLQDAL